MRAHSNPDIDRILEYHGRWASRLELLTRISGEHLEPVAMALDPDADRALTRGTDLLRSHARGGTKLQRRETVAMHNGIAVGGVRIKRLPDHEGRLAVPCRARAEKPDVRRERDIA